MKIIENPALDEKEQSSGTLGSVISSLKFGREWSQDMQAQEGVIAALGKALDNRYIMLRNVILERLDIPIPLVLVGPPGVRVLYPSASRGLYRAKEDVWEKMDDRQNNYKPSTPNLLTRTLLMSRAVEMFLSARGHPQPQVEPVLVFSDPGTHVESVRPAVRIVLTDALERYIAGLLQVRVFLSQEDVQKIVDLLSGAENRPEESGPVPIERDAFSFTDEEPQRKSPLPSVEIPRGERVVSFLNKIPLTTRQWVLLMVMVLFDFFLLIAFLLVVLFLS